MTRLEEAFQRFRATLTLRPGLEQQVTERSDRLAQISARAGARPRSFLPARTRVARWRRRSTTSTPRRCSTLSLANESTFSDAELEAYRKARDEVQQMIQYGRDAEGRGHSLGRAEGRAEGVREAIAAVCELLGVALDDARRAWIVAADTSALDARLASLRASRRWE